VCDRAAPLYSFLGACYAALFLISICLLVEAPSSDDEGGGAAAAKDEIDHQKKRAIDTENESECENLKHQLLYDGADSQLSLPEVSEDRGADAAASSSLEVPQHYRLEPQSVAELIKQPLARLEALSYIFTATAGVFIAGSYKAMAVRHFSDDAFLSNVGRSVCWLNELSFPFLTSLCVVYAHDCGLCSSEMCIVVFLYSHSSFASDFTLVLPVQYVFVWQLDRSSVLGLVLRPLRLAANSCNHVSNSDLPHCHLCLSSGLGKRVFVHPLDHCDLLQLRYENVRCRKVFDLFPFCALPVALRLQSQFSSLTRCRIFSSSYNFAYARAPFRYALPLKLPCLLNSLLLQGGTSRLTLSSRLSSLAPSEAA